MEAGEGRWKDGESYAGAGAALLAELLSLALEEAAGAVLEESAALDLGGGDLFLSDRLGALAVA